ncbi:MAG: 4a-hydroxytetrahydrobiopterin dehydratase, partial [Acidobacteriaceae bacterium]|nr:4a-hydroxytetrahydrobiopterin dehydratase [Acidobacteriaceae bacterium]
VCVELTTHDAGGITQKDIELATMLDQMAAKLSR